MSIYKFDVDRITCVWTRSTGKLFVVGGPRNMYSFGIHELRPSYNSIITYAYYIMYNAPWMDEEQRSRRSSRWIFRRSSIVYTNACCHMEVIAGPMVETNQMCVRVYRIALQVTATTTDVESSRIFNLKSARRRRSLATFLG